MQALAPPSWGATCSARSADRGAAPSGAGAAAGCPSRDRVPLVPRVGLLVPARRAGRLILVDAVPVLVSAGLVAVYARVSSAGQRSDLDWQVARVMAWAAGEGLAAGRVVTAAGPRARIDRG